MPDVENIQLSNVIGAPFSDFVLKQLYIRASRNSSLSRTNEEILFLANKMAWVRLVSSVNIGDLEIQQAFEEQVLKGVAASVDLSAYYRTFNLDPTLYKLPDSLAKNWILQAGTSIQNGDGITLRQGIGDNGAYGLGGTAELGYRPMPGLTSVTIETTGRLGSLRQATVNFKVWNMDQLNVIEALYFRLGYSMLLEWGHTQYYKNNDTNGEFVSNKIFGIPDPFSIKYTKEKLQQVIKQKSQETSGNYDGMLGIVTNFNWSFNQDGGYDCMVRLVGLGSIIDSVRTNQTYTLPEGLAKLNRKDTEAINRRLEAQAKLINQLKQAQNNPPAGSSGDIKDTDWLKPPANSTELLALIQKYQDKSVARIQDAQNSGAYGVYTFKDFEGGPKEDLQVYLDFNGSKTGLTGKDKTEANTRYGGIWYISRPGFFRIPFPTDPATGYQVVLDKTAFTAFTSKIPLVTTVAETERENLRTGLITREGTVQIPVAGSQPFTKLIAVKSGIVSVSNTLATLTTNKAIPLDSPFESQIRGNFVLNDVKLSPTSTVSNTVYLNVTIDTRLDDDYVLTRQEILNAIDKYLSSAEPVATLKSFSKPKLDQGSFEASLVFVVPVTYKLRAGKQPTATSPAELTGKAIQVQIKTNNAGFIGKVFTPPATNKVTGQASGTGNKGNTNGTTNEPAVPEVKPVDSVASALEAMLAIVTNRARAQAPAFSSKKSDTYASAVSLEDITKKFYADGTLDGVFDATVLPGVHPNGVSFDDADPAYSQATGPNSKALVQYALKGFSSNLMADPTLFDITPKVDYVKLSQAILVRYPQQDLSEAAKMLMCPVYIPLGYLLAFLNNMCLIYTSKQNNKVSQGGVASTEKRPYVYIDFNPETNFCLTSPQQLSTDPTICLIPLQCTQTQYKEIFPEELVKNPPKGFPFFDPVGANPISKTLAKTAPFQSTINAYQGKTMNILLNTDYLLTLVGQFATSDKNNSVNLQPFLEQIMTDISKCLGNTNLFRVAYRDDTNTLQIQDDQYVPALAGETSIMDKEGFNSRATNNLITSGRLPLFVGSSATAPGQATTVGGTRSLVRTFEFKTTTSTRLGSMLAISAQAATGSVNAKDHSSLSWLNRNYQDRYKPFVYDPGKETKGTNSGQTSQTNKNSSEDEPNNVKAARLFNTLVLSIYNAVDLFTRGNVDQGKNYYIERMSKVKSTNLISSSAPFIPANLEMTIDGISGMIMGNAFTIPENRLPLSLRGEDGKTKVAFIVVGLQHMIENNEWLTKLRGQMIRLREPAKIVGADQQVLSAQQTGLASSDVTGGVKGIFSKTPRGTDLFKNNNAPATSEYLFGKPKTIPSTPAHANWGGLKDKWENSNAWDIGAAAGTPVYAIVSGVVSGNTFSENGDTVWGYAFYLTGTTSTFFYTHLDSILVSSGTSVTKGQLLGYVGQWPADYVRLSTFSHLHLGVKVGKLLDHIGSDGKLK